MQISVDHCSTSIYNIYVTIFTMIILKKSKNIMKVGQKSKPECVSEFSLFLHILSFSSTLFDFLYLFSHPFQVCKFIFSAKRNIPIRIGYIDILYVILDSYIEKESYLLYVSLHSLCSQKPEESYPFQRGCHFSYKSSISGPK